MKLKKLKNLVAEEEEKNTDDLAHESSAAKKLDFNNDYRHFTYPPVHIIKEDKYCKCGRPRVSYEAAKLSSSFGVKSSCNSFYKIDKLANEILELDENNVYFTTKSSLMLNQFLEYGNETSSPPSCVNETNGGNRFSIINVPTSKGRMKSATFDVVEVPENKNSHALCLPSLAFSDKKLISLFRSVALYWFFCLNTVLTKGEVCRKKAITTVFDLQNGTTTHPEGSGGDPVAVFASNLELRISSDIFDLVAAIDKFGNVNDDFFWRIASNWLRRKKTEGGDHDLLSYNEHSKEKLNATLFKKVLITLANTSGIFRTTADAIATKKKGCDGRRAEKQKPVIVVVTASPALVEKRQEQQQQQQQRPRTPQRKTTNGKNSCRKYALDIFDYGYFGTLFNRIVWKNRSIKNKIKAKKRMEFGSRGDRIQEIIVSCSMEENDVENELLMLSEQQTLEREIRHYENIIKPMDEHPNVPTIVPAAEELVVDFDSYLQEMKRKEQEDAALETITAEGINAFVGSNPYSRVSEPLNSSVTSLEAEDSYFLPGGMLNVEERDYPQYDLWCSPLFGGQVLRSKQAAKKNTRPQQSQPQPPPPPPPKKETFKPYRLWESSFAAEEDYIPNFDNKEDFFSVFSIPYYPRRKKASAQTRPEPSAYSLWGSPNIIDFLPGVGYVRLADDEYSSGTTSSSSESLESNSRNEPYELFKVHRRENHFSRGKFLNFKPVINGFVSFTDRGAFQYYKKQPEIYDEMKMTEGMEMPEFTSYFYGGDGVVGGGETIVGGSDIAASADTLSFFAAGATTMAAEATATGSADTETTATAAVDGETPRKSELEAIPPYYFKPIQPAVKVDTDLPPVLKRSESGTLYHNEQILMPFRHELDLQHDPTNTFQPKFSVSMNDVACQTDRVECFSRVNYTMKCEEDMPHCFGAPGSERKAQEQYMQIFYSLEEFFNFLGKPGLSNIDVKAHVDFSCMF